MQGLVADLMDDTDVNVPVQTDCEARTNQWNEIIAFHLFYAIDFNFRRNVSFLFQARVDPADPLCADLEGY